MQNDADINRAPGSIRLSTQEQTTSIVVRVSPARASTKTVSLLLASDPFRNTSGIVGEDGSVRIEVPPWARGTDVVLAVTTDGERSSIVSHELEPGGRGRVFFMLRQEQSELQFRLQHVEPHGPRAFLLELEKRTNLDYLTEAGVVPDPEERRDFILFVTAMLEDNLRALSGPGGGPRWVFVHEYPPRTLDTIFRESTEKLWPDGRPADPRREAADVGAALAEFAAGRLRIVRYVGGVKLLGCWDPHSYWIFFFSMLGQAMAGAGAFLPPDRIDFWRNLLPHLNRMLHLYEARVRLLPADERLGFVDEYLEPLTATLDDERFRAAMGLPVPGPEATRDTLEAFILERMDPDGIGAPPEMNLSIEDTRGWIDLL